jgi:hypothetical protein
MKVFNMEKKMQSSIYLNLSKGGSLSEESLNRLKSGLKGLEGAYVLTCKAIKPTRSNKQNAYIHAVFNFLAMKLDHYGMDSADWKEHYKHKFLTAEKVVKTPEGDVVITYVKSTTSLDTEEMAMFIDNMLHDASKEHHVYVASPEEYLQGEME